MIRLAEAGVTTPVIRTFVESSPPGPLLTHRDVIALKQHGVADEVVVVLVKQAAKKHEQEARVRVKAEASALAARRARTGGLDPESYDYFQYYYLQPRAMASAYRRLYPYSGSWNVSPYGAPPGHGFGTRVPRRPF